MEAQRKAIRAMVAKAQGLDLCFLLDATVSMQTSMDMVKTRVAEMVGGIKAAYSECDLRMSVVLYRDYDYHDMDENEGCDFTTDFNGLESTFMKSLLSVRATTGDPNPDVAEDVFTGLQRVANLDWQAASRLLVHICDAPCHGTRFHDLRIQNTGDNFSNDQYPHGDKYGRDIADLLQQLREHCQITRYFFCHITDHTIKMIHEFKKVIGETDWINDVRFENVNVIPKTVISISRSTISKTISASMAGLNTHTHGFDGNQFIPESVVEGRPDWVKVRELEGQLYKHKWYSSLEELLTRIKHRQPIDFEEMDPLMVKIAPNPFSDEGAIRWPYHARVLQLHSKRMVVKRFKMPSQIRGNTRSIQSKERYLSQMEVQTVAAQMGHDFNERWYNMEEYLEGNWIRYSNNAGYVNTEDYATTLQVFTHWTYERSRGELMVTDLQGVFQSTPGTESRMFWLCDPAIHCHDLTRFTGTNLGENGFQLFFRTHKCDDLCSLLGLKPYRSDNTKGSLGRDATLASIEE